MIFLFWTLLLSILYCYFGYPLCLRVVTKVFARPVRKEKMQPSISVILSVHNEEDVIQKKIENLLDLDYPKTKLEILIGSDGSDDKTNAIVKSLKSRKVKLFEFTERRGKMLTLNDLVKHAKNEVLVFTDARQKFDKDAVQQLVNNFADNKVGCVSGELMFSTKEGSTSKGINLYWNYEKFLRSQESQIHSMLGATGAIYAMRKELYVPIPVNVVLDDMYVPLKVIEKGYRAIFDGSAKAYDEIAESPKEEYRRKARTLYGNYQIFGIFPNLFNPFTSPVAFQLFSHKLLRVLVPIFMVLLVFVNYFLIWHAFYYLTFLCQLIFYTMAVIGAYTRYEKEGILGKIARVCYIPYVFCLLNFSALVGLLRYVNSSQEITWQKARKG